MKTKPKQLTYLSVFLIGVAIALPIQIMLLYGNTPFEISAILAKLGPVNWMILGFAPVTALLVYRASPWIALAVPTLISMVAYNNWLVAAVGNDFSSCTTGIATLAFASVIVYGLSQREVRELILHPSKRWWLTPERWRASLPMRIKVLAKEKGRKKGEVSGDFYTVTFDISETGAFIPFDAKDSALTTQMTSLSRARARLESATQGAEALKGLSVGTQCFISLPMAGLSYIQCRAEVVRATPGGGKYPGGVGVRFLGLSWQERQKLGTYLKEVAMQSAPVLHGSGAGGQGRLAA